MNLHFYFNHRKYSLEDLSIYVSLVSQLSFCVYVGGVLGLKSSGRRYLSVPPYRLFYVLLVGHHVFDGVLNVREVATKTFVVAFLGQVSNSESTEKFWILGGHKFVWEIHLRAVSLAERIKSASLTYAIGKRRLLV